MKPSQAARRSASASSPSSSPKLLLLRGTTAQAFFRTASRCRVKDTPCKVGYNQHVWQQLDGGGW
jgi:hypothetical protein